MLPFEDEPNLDLLENLFRGETGVSQRDREEIVDIVQRIFSQARAFKSPLQGKLDTWRKMFDLVPPEAPFEGALTAASPVVRQKADGIRAHIKMSIDREPMFTLRAYSSEAADVAPALESVLERELVKTSSKHEIERAIDEAVIYGTGIIKIVIHPAEDGEVRVGFRHVPLRNVWVWPDKYDPKRLAWFEAYWQPRWEIDRLAASGYYDQEEVAKLNEVASSQRYTSDEMGAMPAVQSPDQRWYEVVEAWLVHNGRLRRVVFTASGTVILRVEDEPYGGALEYPPYFPIYIDPDPVSVWGHGLGEVLESMQIVSDAALNNELWSAQYKMRPPVLVKAGSQVHRAIERSQGLFPGQVLPYEGVDAENIIRVLEYSANPFNMQILSLMNQLTEDATISDFVVPGVPLGGRRTATEVQITSSIGQLKLANYLRHVQRYLEHAVRVYWDVLVNLKISQAQVPGLPPGVYRTWSYSGGGKVYVAERDVRVLYPDRATGQVYEIRIPGARRDDADWVLTGSITIPERELRIQRLSTLINPAMLQLIQAARQDPGIHVLMRRFLDALGFAQDAELILGPPPTPMSPGQAALSGLLEGMLGVPPEGGQGATRTARQTQAPERTPAGGQG